ncbi:hypothetical protein [Streptococcus suis]|uniref:hypothetical protein n=1 Tax=Streptococcus suis TaxID=1307 RepID=UPI002FC80621
MAVANFWKMNKEMTWIEWVIHKPQSREEIINKIKADGYTFPAYDKEKNNVKKVTEVSSIDRDCQRLGLDLYDVWPYQFSLFEEEA